MEMMLYGAADDENPNNKFHRDDNMMALIMLPLMFCGTWSHHKDSKAKLFSCKRWKVMMLIIAIIMELNLHNYFTKKKKCVTKTTTRLDIVRQTTQQTI